MTEAGWTSEKPTEAGWYWYQGDTDLDAVVVWVAPNMHLINLSHRGPVRAFDGKWLGPITPTDRQQGRVEGIQESKNLVSEFIEAWLLAGMVAKLLTPAVHEAVGGLSRDLRRELQKIEQAAQDEKGVGEL